MFYPEDFKQRVKETYPTNLELHQALENGDTRVGKYLYEDFPHRKEFFFISQIPAVASLILSATSLEDLQTAVRDAQTHLYGEWLKLPD